MATQEICRVVSNVEVGSGLFALTMEAPVLCEQAKPGQFVHITCGEGNLLRRPISICNVAQENMTIVFQVKGDGTAWLSKRRTGDTLDVLGTLGHGFRMEALGDHPVFIGGGIGVPPLLGAAKKFGKNATVAVGFRNKDTAILEADFARAGCRVFVATDDGSMGHHGLVIDCTKDVEADVIFACGPTPMLKAVCALAKERGIPCQISLEERMACGIGACLGCATPLLREDGTQYFGHVCKDGPVFDYTKVVL